MKLQNKILLALVAGIAVGAVARLPAAQPLQQAVVFLEPLGIAFIRLITMVVVPLVVASVFVGVASLGDIRRLGRIGGRTLAWFLITTLAAATIGVAAARLTRVGHDAPPSIREPLTADVAGTGATPAAAAPALSQTLMAMVPQNPFAAAAQTDLLPLMIAVCIFGAAATVVAPDRRRAVVEFFSAVNDLAMVVIGWLMKLAPAAVFVLIAAVVARVGIGVLQVLVRYAAVVVAALLLHAALLIVVVRFVGRRSVSAFLRGVSDALLLAFSTASSNATLPVSMAAATTRLGIPAAIVGFVLPAGSTLNKNGAAIYKAITAVFVAELCGMSIGPGEMATIVLASTLAAFAGTGVPGSSLVTTLIVLNAIGLGASASAAVALVASIDRPLDMCRTTVNTLGNLVVATLVGRDEDPTAVRHAAGRATDPAGG